jgi:Fe-S oxidoreductase
MREGNLEAPTRHPIDWRSEAFYDEDALMHELERVFDLCHGCRRCVSLCQSFPTLFDLVDDNPTMEVEGVAKEDYWKVVDHCYLCDLCYMTKCPYTPPHEWNLDFPHLMLRAKAVKYRKEGAKFRDRLLTSTDLMGGALARPLIAPAVNAVNKLPALRSLLETTLAVHHSAWVPEYTTRTMRKRLAGADSIDAGHAVPAGRTTGKVALYTTCYGNYSEPGLGEDIFAVYEHNGIHIRIVGKEKCCGMPKLELGDFESVAESKDANIPVLAKLVDEGYDIVAPVPSCALMFRQELPLMFPDDEDVQKVARAFFDPFEYLMLRHKEGKLATDFKNPLGKVAYQAACHQRVQNVGQKTRELLSLIPGTEVQIIERCSGHDGTWGVKSEFFDKSMKIGKPVFRQMAEPAPDYVSSDCAIAARHILQGMGEAATAQKQHPITLLRIAYGLE